mmetsp:Transcript_1883/g.2432  ORF Transcript_1883/g.2432 Transcript_1883/m.2432 type:complete len:226 (-) Transcript_1883:1117-1794(-)
MDSDSDAPLEISKETGKREFVEQRSLERLTHDAVKKKKSKRRKRTEDVEVKETIDTSNAKEQNLGNELLATVAKLKQRQEKLKKDQEKKGVAKDKIKHQIIIGSRAKQTGFIPSARNDNIQIAYYDENEEEYVYGEAPDDSENEENSEAEKEPGSSENKKTVAEEGNENKSKVVEEYEDEHQLSAKTFMDTFLNGSRLNRVPYDDLQESGNHRRKTDPKYRSTFY